MQRSPEQIREHYEVERELATRLRQASVEERKSLYGVLYDELYRRVPHHPQPTRKRSPKQAETEVRDQARFLKGIVRESDVYLEIGPGDCALAFEMARTVRRCIGVDVSAEIAAHDNAPPNFELLLSDGTSIPVPAGTVDVAFSNQLMEHLHPEDARAQLLNISRSLRRGGRYVCLTPNRLTGPHDISREFDDIATGLHLHEYTNLELIALFLDCGFRRVAMYSSIRKRVFRIPCAPVLAVEGWLLGLPSAGRRLVTRQRLVRKFLGNCGLVAIK